LGEFDVFVGSGQKNALLRDGLEAVEVFKNNGLLVFTL